MAKNTNNSQKNSSKSTQSQQSTTLKKGNSSLKENNEVEILSESPKFSFWRNTTLHQWLIFAFAFLLYANTIPNEYAVDDSIVIQRNNFTKKGLKGMYGIWFKDTFVGFFGDERNLVSGGRYRPLTVATFAVENQLFGQVIRNNAQYNVSTTVVSKVQNKEAILAKIGNPKHEEISRNGDTLRMNVVIEPGGIIPDKDGDVNYLGNPHISHAINAILFGVLSWLLYLWILMMFDPKKNGNSRAIFIALTAALLFAAHPLHTEAVANIKGRDEVVVTLLSVLAAYLTMKSFTNSRWYLYLSAAILSFFLALFAKESAIPFLVVIPAAIYFFQTDIDLKTIAIRTSPFLIAVVVFWFGIRNPILKWPNKQAPPPELMNDPFLKLVPNGQNQNIYVPFSSEEKSGMILHTWMDYIKLLAVPYPLTNDYYPKHIGVEASAVKPSNGNNITELKDEKGRVRYIRDAIPTFSSPMVLLSILTHLGLAILAIYGLMKRKPYAFAIIFYAATFSVVSNLFFPIGTLMAERFMFMPSIAFSLISAMGLAQLASKNNKFSIANSSLPMSIFAVVTVIYSVITFDRNFDWYDDYVLFTTDIAVSQNSAKLNNAVSGVLQDKAGKAETPATEKEQLYMRAMEHSKNAVKIHPTYNNAWLLLGNSHIFLGNIREAQADSLRKSGNQQLAGAKYSESLMLYTEGIKAYNEVSRLRPDHPDVPINLTAAHRNRGKLFGEKLGNVVEALKDLEESNKWGKNKDVETLRLMGVAYGITGINFAQAGKLPEAIQSHKKAIDAFQRALQNAPDYVPTLYNLEVAYRQMVDLDPANREQYLPKVEELNKKWKSINPDYNPAVPQPETKSTQPVAPSTPLN